MKNDLELISVEDHAALLREGVVVVTARVHDGELHVNVTGDDETRVREAVRLRLGADVNVGVCGAEPRAIRPVACCGQTEREPGRLQLRYIVRGDEHLDEIDVMENDDTVIIYGTMCTPVRNDGGWERDSPYHVYLGGPLAGRTVIDGVTGQAVPHGNACELSMSREAN